LSDGSCAQFARRHYWTFYYLFALTSRTGTDDRPIVAARKATTPARRRLWQELRGAMFRRLREMLRSMLDVALTRREGRSVLIDAARR
jgi:hypothetical protein